MSSLKFLTLSLFFIFSSTARAGDYDNVYPVSIHIHSDQSSGARPISKIASVAQKQNVGAIIMTDLYHEKYEYGFWPLQGLFKKTIERDSIMKSGPEVYFREMRWAMDQNPGTLVIDGAAVTPFYYWTGSLWPGPLVMNARAKDLLILGLGRPDNYKNLPVVANGRSGFDAYHGDQHAAPYQKLIDEANSRGGLVFWSHPEANEHMAFQDSILGTSIVLETKPYGEMLPATFNYAGFGMFPTDLSQINAPGFVTTASTGGIWDRLLNEHCLGRRNAVWVIGEADYNGTENGIKDLDGILNMVFAEAMTREAILNALASGRLYVIIPARHDRRLLLDRFQVGDLNGHGANAGETSVISGAPQINLKMSFSDGSSQALEILLIRNGEVIHQWNETAPFDLVFQDHGFPEDRKSYYRVIAYSADSPDRLITNPVFAELRRDH